MADQGAIVLNLQLFEGGGAGGAGGGGAAGGDGGAAGTGAAGTAAAGEAAGKGAKGAQADLSGVKYGVQEAAEQPEAETLEQPEQPQQKPAPRKSFDQLVKEDAEYAREMQKRIDQAINKRFAKAKASEETNAKLMPALNLLAAKYGVEAGNTEALIDAINGDSDLIEQQAMDAGMEPDAYREYQKLKAENEALKKAEEERQRQTQLSNQYNEWVRQANDAQRIFPTLNLQAEVQNPMFAQLLGAGIDVLTAFQTVHMDEIQKGLILRAAADAKKATVASIAAKQGRPRENGAAKPQAAAVKTDPKTLSRADFDEITRRAARGERIRF